MKKLMALLALSALVGLAPPPAQAAGSVSGTYIAASALSNSSWVNPTSALNQNNRIHPLGGISFTPDANNFRIQLLDLGSGLANIPVAVCQEKTTDPTQGDTSLCGDGGDDVDLPTLCTNAQGRVNITSTQGFQANSPVLVTIWVTNFTCTSYGTAGTVTVNWPIS